MGVILKGQEYLDEIKKHNPTIQVSKNITVTLDRESIMDSLCGSYPDDVCLVVGEILQRIKDKWVTDEQSFNKISAKMANYVDKDTILFMLKIVKAVELKDELVREASLLRQVAKNSSIDIGDDY